MGIEPISLILGVIVGVGIILLLYFIMLILKPWCHAYFSGAPVSLLCIVGMRLRGNPPMLLIEAFINLRKTPVETSILGSRGCVHTKQ